MDIAVLLGEELGIRPEQVRSVMDLLADGCTIPFIARYRKEATGGLDDG
ncbi:Tex-like N-terminal domain-containing protein [Parvibacter caecicola]